MNEFRRLLVGLKYTFFIYKNTVYKNTEAEIWYQFFAENGEIFAYYKSKEKQFKHIFRGRVCGKSPKIGLEFKNISGSEKIKIFL